MRVSDVLSRSRLDIFNEVGSLARTNRLFRETYSSANPELPPVAGRFESPDGTRRYLIRLDDGESIESVLIPEEDRFTFCVSSQAGCALACTFCLTGQLGLMRNLTAGEIVSQVMLLRQEAWMAARSPSLRSGFCQSSRNVQNPERSDGLCDTRFSVVFMGMGEPLQNYDNVLKAIEILTDDYGLAIPLRRITVSTAGIVPAIERLAAEPRFPNLSISLTGTTDELRNELMPINRRYPISAVIEAVRRVRSNRRKRVMFEYVMIKGITDTTADAQRLCRITKGLGTKVNLIPVNESKDIPYKRPSDSTVLEFQAILLRNGITAFIRKTRGNDVCGACGQLKKQVGDFR